MSRVIPEPMSGCWLWFASYSRHGYGTFSARAEYGRVVTAHRYSWAHFYGPIPEGMCVLHRCDVPPCVNPAHLFLGTQNENIADMMRKGRANKGRVNRTSFSRGLVPHNIAAVGETRVRRKGNVSRRWVKIAEPNVWRRLERVAT